MLFCAVMFVMRGDDEVRSIIRQNIEKRCRSAILEDKHDWKVSVVHISLVGFRLPK